LTCFQVLFHFDRLTIDANAPSNAAALTAQGWQRLLQNLSIRLKQDTKTIQDAERILSIIAKR
jgi:hypothetical protein